MTYIETILKGGLGTIMGVFAIVLVMIILNKYGLLKFFLKNGDNKISEKLEADLVELKDNHIHEIKELLVEIRDSLKEIRDYTRDSFNILSK